MKWLNVNSARNIATRAVCDHDPYRVGRSGLAFAIRALGLGHYCDGQLQGMLDARGAPGWWAELGEPLTRVETELLDDAMNFYAKAWEAAQEEEDRYG